MRKAPKPTGLKSGVPPHPTDLGETSFSYEREKEKPGLDKTHPKVASILHFAVVSVILAGAFVVGAGYVILRSGRELTTAPLAILALLGGGCGVAIALKLGGSGD